MPEYGASRTQRLREQAAAERRKVRELDGLLARLEARLATAAGRERRVFERIDADLLIRYRPPGRPTIMVGRVRDLSRGGLRFVASNELRVGTTLQAVFQRRGGPVPGFTGEIHMEVVRCRRADQVWEIGARFTAARSSPAAGAERRRNQRHLVRLEAAMRVPGDTMPATPCQVRDISTGGLRFICARPVPAGALAAVSIFSQPQAPGGAAERLTLNATVRIVRCRRVGTRYEAGAQFVSSR
jgi:hypothetical protein